MKRFLSMLMIVGCLAFTVGCGEKNEQTDPSTYDPNIKEGMNPGAGIPSEMQKGADGKPMGRGASTGATGTVAPEAAPATK